MRRSTEERPSTLPPNSLGVKTLVRNCRSLPTSSNCRSNSAQLISCANKESPSVNGSVPLTSTSDVNLDKPQLQTTLKIQENIRKMKSGLKSVSCQPKLQDEAPSKPSGKVNLRFDQKTYKNLIELKISDEDFGHLSTLNVKSKELTSKVKEPAPILADHYKPSFDKEYVVKPAIPIYPITRRALGSHKISSVLEATKRWNVDADKLV